MRRRSGTEWAALLGEGMAWFGSAAFLLGLAGEHVDALVSGSWPHAVGFAMISVAGVGLVVRPHLVGALAEMVRRSYTPHSERGT